MNDLTQVYGTPAAVEICPDCGDVAAFCVCDDVIDANLDYDAAWGDRNFTEEERAA